MQIANNFCYTFANFSYLRKEAIPRQPQILKVSMNLLSMKCLVNKMYQHLIETEKVGLSRPMVLVKL